MAVGRITGPLLAKNLLRDGVDLSFETDLLYLDVTNGRIGIKSASPQYDLDVGGTARTQNLQVDLVSQLANLTISSTDTATSLVSNAGNIIIQAPVESKVLIQNNLEVKGNIRATGNISAGGNVQIGNVTGTDTLSLYADIVSDITPQTANNYNIGSAEQTFANGYFNNLLAEAYKGLPGQPINIGTPPGQDANILPITNPLINLNGNVRIWGDNPLGTGPVTANILYVNEDGSDTNDGRGQDATRACRTITGAVRSPYYQLGTTIRVAPGRYLEDNPIELKPYSSVIGNDLRTTSVEPINKTQDLFHVQSGNYIAQMQFLNGQSGLLPGIGYTAGTNRGAYATAFPPNYGGAKIDLYHSPYIQNCTNQSGPWLNDGTMFFPNSTVQIPDAVGTATWEANTTTLTVSISEGTLQVGQNINIGPTPQDYINARTLLLANIPFFQEQVIAYVDQNNTYFGYNKETCIRDTGLIVDSLITDLLFPGNGFTQSTFAGLQYWNQNGYTGNIAGEISTTTNTIGYVSTLAQKIIKNSASGPRYQSTATQTTGTVASNTQSSIIASEFQLIIDILNTGTSGVTDSIVPNGTSVISTDAQNAYNLLQANKTYIQAEAIAYIEVASPGFEYDRVKCYRDVGYMIDSVCFDILYGGNRQAIQSAVYYYGFSNTSSVIATERPQVTAAYYRIKDIVANIVTDQTIVKSEGNLSSQTTNLPAATNAEATTLKAMVDEITQIINAGPDAASSPSPVSLTRFGNTNILRAVDLLKANKAFITSEIISYVDQFYNNKFAYNQPKCFRDTGYIVDSIAFDILYNGTTQSTFAGLQYWNQNSYTGDIGKEITTTTNAIKFVKEISQQIIVNATGTRYQSTLTQFTGPASTLAQQVALGKEFDIIITVLNTGTAALSDSIIPNGSVSTDPAITSAYSLLQANKEYIQAETVAWVEANKTAGFVYDSQLCFRDVGYIIDSISFDTLHGGNRQAWQSAVYYYGFDSNTTNIPQEIPQVTAAYNHIRNIIGKILTGQTITVSAGNTSTQVVAMSTATSAQVISAYQKIDGITDIINNGPSVAPAKQPISLTPSVNPNDQFAYDLLLANRKFIQDETIAFTNLFDTGFVYNRAKCKRDIGIVVENIAYDVAFGGNQKSVESGLAYWNGVTSYIANEITTTTTAFSYLESIAQNVLANSTATNLLNTYQSSPQVINTALVGGATAGPIVTKLIGVINNIIANGPQVAPTSQVGNGPDWGSVSAEVLLQSNRKFIQNEVIDYVNQTFPNFTYREDLCFRDTGLIIDAVSQDIVRNANSKSIEAAKTYWTGNINAVRGEINETVAALTYAKSLALDIISNTTVTNIAFTFNPVKCSRDTGLIVDALAQDLLFDGTSQTTFAGIQYWNHGNYVGNIPSEINTTTAAINYIKGLAIKAVVNDTSGIRYQSTVSQSTSFLYGTINEQTAIGNNFSVITNILQNGVTGVTDSIIPNGLEINPSTDVQNAVALLQANKEYFKAEAIAWVEANKDFRYDQVKCSRDTGLIVDSIAFDLAYPSGANSQSTFAGLSYWNQTGYTGAIGTELTTTTNAINYVSSLTQQIVRNITGSIGAGSRYQNSISQITGSPATWIEANAVKAEFQIITNIISSGTSGVTDLIVPNDLVASTVTNTVNAYNLLQANKAYIQAEAVAFVEATKGTGFVYDPITCYRDVGYMVDSVSFDILHGGNRQAIQSGVYYYTFNSTSSAIVNEIPQTIAAYEFIETLSKQISRNILVTPQQTEVAQITTGLTSADASIVTEISDKTGKIINILKNGPDVVTTKQPIGLTANTDNNYLVAATNLLANRDFIRAETIAYINNKFAFKYNADTCARDVGYIIDSVSFDVLYGGNRQSIQSGVYYWGYNKTSTSLPKERSASTQAYNYLKELTNNIIIGAPISTPYQLVVPQVTSASTGTSIEAGVVTKNIERIINIINSGPDIVTEKTPIGLVQSNNTFVNNAAYLLHANRDFIRAEVNAFVTTTIVNNSQVFLPFYDKGANATLSVIRNFDLINNILINGPGVAPTTTQGNGVFNYTGLVGNDVKIAPIVTSINTVTTNTYEITISESTVGYGDNEVLYFGSTLVFPAIDEKVPDRWQQRRVNPIGSMGGSLVDGAVVSDRSPIQSFVYDAFTQVNQGGIGIRITNNGYAQLVSVFTIFCSNAVIAENGGICSITNSNSNFGDICLLSKGYGKREFSGYIKNPAILPYYPTGFYPRNSEIEIYIPDPDLRPHIALVMEVKPPVGFTNYQGLPGFLSGNGNTGVLTTGTIVIDGIDTTGMVVGQSFYIKDQYGRQVDNNNQPYVREGTIVSDINYQSITLNYPLNSGGGDPNNANYFNLYTCGNAYYTVLSSVATNGPFADGTLLLPGEQNGQEAVSLNFIGTLSQSIIANQAVTPLQTSTSQVFDLSLSGGSGAGSFITDRLNLIGSILVNGIESAPTITQTGTLPTGAATAASLLNKNRTFIQDEAIAYVDQTYPPFVYDKVLCYRDTGLIIDALAQDLLFTTSSQSTFAGLQYWDQGSYTGAIGSEITTTTNTLVYLKTLTGEIVRNITGGVRYSAGSQITGSPATLTEANTIGDKFDVILNILNNGVSGVTDAIQPNSLDADTSTYVVRAYDLLLANKTYIQEEAVAYVESTKTPGFVYTTATCYRDVGYMVDSVAFDLLYGGNRQSVQSGVYYYGYSTTSSQVSTELPEVTAAYDHLKIITDQIIRGELVTTYQNTVTQVTNLSTGTTIESAIIQNSISTITNIINNGPSVVTNKTPISLDRSTDVNVIAAAEILEANRTFIQAETIAWVDSVYSSYNKETCRRDVGFIVDALIYDLEKGGNYNAVIAGKSYYAQDGTYHRVLIEENITDPTLFPDGAIVTFYQRSYMSASGYLFEYVGSGIQYGALPQRGKADPVQTKETVQLSNGKVFFTSTDQNGDFRIGPGLVISQATGVLSGRTFTKSLFANLTPFILAIEGT